MQQQQQLLATQAEEQGELEAAGGGEDDFGGDMFGGQTDEADGLAELGVGLESPGAPPGSEAAGSGETGGVLQVGWPWPARCHESGVSQGL